MKATVLPESFLKCMRAEDRKSLGKAGRTQSEANEKCVARSERELQKNILNLLRLRGIEVIVNRMDRKTSNNLGTPDFLFSVRGHNGFRPAVYPCAIEVKMPGENLSDAQKKMEVSLMAGPNCWVHRVVHSVDEMRSFLEGLGL